jgi:cytidylate kinase
MNRVIAIDGPSGSGKSTVARALAERLGLDYLDTGAMYRAATWAAMEAGVDLHDVERVAELVAVTPIDVSLEVVAVGGADATAVIRGPEVSQSVSIVAAQTAVRADLRGRQRAWVDQHGGGVVEGRDIGSVVFPEARLKVYLTASPEARARRRAAERGDHDEIEIAATAAELERRDHLDSTRSDSPLLEADGAVLLDTTGMSVEDVVARIVGMLR